MKSKVFFAKLGSESKKDLLKRIGELLELLELPSKVRKGDLCAVKVHFGERGNTSFVRPLLLRPIVQKLKEAGGRPFLTDTNTLYAGGRSEAVSHLETALQHGFCQETVGAPVIIADGLWGNASVQVEIPGEIYREVSIAHTIYYADCLVAVSHFKGHDLAGFGGALKNLGMGCASRKGKLEQHSEVKPRVKPKKCKGCGRCIQWCAHGAISLKGDKAWIDEERCVGCGECIVICPDGAIRIDWKTDPGLFQRKMVEYAMGALRGKEGKAFFLNFLLQITPYCDCYPSSDAPIVGDIGVLASLDPVAIDQASVDLVNAQPGNPSSRCRGLGRGDDKFRTLHEGVDWEVQLSYAERLGLGTRGYDLVDL